MLRNRQITTTILKKSDTKFGRIIVLTGARQTGKTTLVKKAFPNYTYISIEDPLLRSAYTQLTAAQWKELYPKATLDEVQKEPQIIESIKSAYDQFEDVRYILLGSSQLLLMEKVRESLAGRCSIYEIYPLTLPEIRTKTWDDTTKSSLFQREITDKNPEFLPSFLLDAEMALKQQALENYLNFGGYPALTDKSLTEKDKRDWLKNYIRTYLERDIRDLASFRDLEPFIKLQQYLAQNTGQLINASEISKQLGISVKTVQRYIKYTEISYQTITLQPWTRNPNKRLIKTPKVHFFDNGVLQAVLQKQGGITGNEFESAIISEIFKQTRNIQAPANFYFLRTQDQKEVDLLIEFSDYYYAFEIKMAEKTSKTDIKHLRGLEEILDKPIKKAFLLSNDKETHYFQDNIIGINAAMFLG